MRIGECFSADYVTARGKFRDAAAEAGSAIASYVNPAPSPTGAELVTDAAWLGTERPARLLIVMSGTHGVEGFAVRVSKLACCEAAWCASLRGIQRSF